MWPHLFAGNNKENRAMGEVGFSVLLTAIGGRFARDFIRTYILICTNIHIYIYVYIIYIYIYIYAHLSTHVFRVFMLVSTFIAFMFTSACICVFSCVFAYLFTCCINIRTYTYDSHDSIYPSIYRSTIYIFEYSQRFQEQFVIGGARQYATVSRFCMRRKRG